MALERQVAGESMRGMAEALYGAKRAAAKWILVSMLRALRHQGHQYTFASGAKVATQRQDASARASHAEPVRNCVFVGRKT